MKNARVQLTAILIAVMALYVGAEASQVIDNFEYANDSALQAVWQVRDLTSANTAINLTTDPCYVHDGSKALNYQYMCGNSPYWTEIFRIFDTNQDWSAYNRFNMWLKGGPPNAEYGYQNGLEDVYLVLYTTKPNFTVPLDHSGLSLLGKVWFWRGTDEPNWTLWQADISWGFLDLSKVRAVGFGMQPNMYDFQDNWSRCYFDGFEVTHSDVDPSIINDFEQYANTNALLADIATATAPDAVPVTISLEVNDANVHSGSKAIMMDYNNTFVENGGWSRIALPLPNAPQDWYDHPFGATTVTGQQYKTLSVWFKVGLANGYLEADLKDLNGYIKFTADYDGNNVVPAGDWTRWDITLPHLDPCDPNLTNTLASVELVMKGGTYGHGIVYFDDIFVERCTSILSQIATAGEPFTFDPWSGDINYQNRGDCKVNFIDYAALAAQWLNPCSTSGGNKYCKQTDLNQDEKVDYYDLAIMANNWLYCGLYHEADCGF
ncbi:MAG: carbohydrate binding domain-containing protein [Sedimentisphaerales bacterium]